MNSVYIFMLLLLIFSLYFIIPKKHEYFTQTCTPRCDTHDDDGTCGSINTASLGNINFNRVCPSDPDCVAQCLDMFTWTSDSFRGRPVVMGNLKEPNHKNYFFCTRCNECINNFYDGLSLLNTPHQQSCPAPDS